MNFLSAALRTRRRKLAVAGFAAVMAVGGIAYAASVTGDVSNPTYHSITPCRIVDTRSGLGGKSSKFTSGQTKDYTFVGRCPVPSTIASTINASVTAVTLPGAVNAGYLRIWGIDTGSEPEPGATFMNYGTSYNTNVIGPIRGNGSGKFRVKNYGGPTHLVIDVLGYWSTN